MNRDQIEAIANVVERVSSYQDGATEGTVEHELRGGLSEVGVEATEEQISALVAAIADDDGTVDVEKILS